MADPRTRVRLQDILDEIEGIRSVTAGLTFVESPWRLGKSLG